MIESISSERKKAYQKVWRQTHREEAKKYSRTWYRANKEQAYEVKKKWAKTHPEIIKKSGQKFYQAHKELVQERSKKWAKTHPESMKKASKKWYQSHREQAIKSATKRNQSEKGIAYRQEYLKRIKLNVLTHYGNGSLGCVLCGHGKLTSLSIDHINGGGCKHRKELSMGSGSGFYLWLIKNNYPKGFRTLCLNCQFDEKARLMEEIRRKIR